MTSVHGEVKARLYRRILLDRVFTVTELCANSGLRTEQVYPLLAKLRRSGYLTAESIHGESKRRPHRPILLYTLSEDPEKRKQLAEEIRPFLQLESQIKVESKALERLQQNLLIWIARFQRLPALTEKFSLVQMDKVASFIRDFELRVSELKNDIEIAWYECHGPANKALVDDFEAAKSIFQTTVAEIARLKNQLEIQKSELIAEQQFSLFLKTKVGKDGWFTCSFRKLFDLLEEEYAQNDNFYLRKILSSVSARASLSPLATPVLVLVEAAIRFGAESKLAFEWLRSLREQERNEDVTVAYNFLNACLLAREEALAFEAWKSVIVQQKDLLEMLGSVKQLASYKGTVLETGDVSNLGPQQLAELTTRVGPHGGFSMASVSSVEPLATTAYVMKPTLADWDEPKSAGFIVSTSLRSEQDNFLAYGPVTDIVQFPGLPRVRLAIALVRLGVAVETAWRVTENLRTGKVILLLHIPSTAGGSTSGNLLQPLPGFKSYGMFENPDPVQSSASDRAA